MKKVKKIRNLKKRLDRAVELDKINNQTRLQDVAWISSLSHSQMDFLISLKLLITQRAERIGCKNLADRFDLKTIRAIDEYNELTHLYESKTESVNSLTLSVLAHSLALKQEEYGKRIIERDSQEAPGDDVESSHQSDNNIFLDVVGGVDKKGRIYGLGLEAGKYKRSRSFTSDGISQSEYEQMRAENAFLKEKLKTREELIRASQEDSRLLREQLTKFMEIFSQGHHLPPPPPLST